MNKLKKLVSQRLTLKKKVGKKVENKFYAASNHLTPPFYRVSSFYKIQINIFKLTK